MSKKIIFYEGQILTLENGEGWDAKKGAHARVNKTCFEGDPFVDVHWVDVIGTGLRNCQCDGEYYPTDFKEFDRYPIDKNLLYTDSTELEKWLVILNN